MKPNCSFQIVLVAAVVSSFSSCAGDPKGKRPPVHSEPTSSLGTRIGESVGTGAKYLVGVPYLVFLTVLGPLAGATPSDVLPKFQELHDSTPSAEKRPGAF
jgi:hypothetical protein